MITLPGATLWARLPAGGWQVGFWLDSAGRTAIDVADPWGTLAHRVMASRRPVPSIELAWAGRARGRGGAALRWALAVGHAPAGTDQAVSVSFAGPPLPPGTDGPGHHDTGGPGALAPAGASDFRLTNDGLWVAATAGAYTHVWLTAGSATLSQPLRPFME
jgi:hypothetical protein